MPQQFQQTVLRRHGAFLKRRPQTGRARGFTIVELLIVIVVIAILAAMTLVTYNGVQQRARNVSAASGAKVWLSAFKLYVATNGTLPPLASGTAANYCLGQAVTSCTAATTNWTRDTTQLEPALQTMINILPTPVDGPGTTTTSDPAIGYIPYRGGTTSPTLDGVSSAFLVYILEGANTTCPVGPIASGVWPSFSSTTPAQGYTYAVGAASVCWVPISQPPV